MFERISHSWLKRWQRQLNHFYHSSSFAILVSKDMGDWYSSGWRNRPQKPAHHDDVKGEDYYDDQWKGQSYYGHYEHQWQDKQWDNKQWQDNYYQSTNDDHWGDKSKTEDDDNHLFQCTDWNCAYCTAYCNWVSYGGKREDWLSWQKENWLRVPYDPGHDPTPPWNPWEGQPSLDNEQATPEQQEHGHHGVHPPDSFQAVLGQGVAGNDGGEHAAGGDDAQAPAVHGHEQGDTMLEAPAEAPGQVVPDLGINDPEIQKWLQQEEQENKPMAAYPKHYYPEEQAPKENPSSRPKTHAEKADEEFTPTKFGWMNHCTVMISLFQMKRWAKLAEVASKLACTEAQSTRVQMLNSHIQKYGDSGPKRLGYPF